MISINVLPYDNRDKDNGDGRDDAEGPEEGIHSCAPAETKLLFSMSPSSPAWIIPSMPILRM
jgi:hypothetical protein